MKKAEKAVDEDDLVVCLLTSDNKQEKEMKKVCFMKNVTKSTKASMLCTIHGETFHSFKKRTYICCSGTYHITNDDNFLYDISKINESVEGSSGNMSATKKGKNYMKVCQVASSNWVHTQWS